MTEFARLAAGMQVVQAFHQALAAIFRFSYGGFAVSAHAKRPKCGQYHMSAVGRRSLEGRHHAAVREPATGDGQPPRGRT